MRAIQITFPESKPLLKELEIPAPIPGKQEILIRVHAAAVTPTELLWYPTSHTISGEARESAIPGHEFSGVVAALGEGAQGFVVGDEVYGMNDWFADGATAEYCITNSASIALKPVRLTHAEAASVPISALTAWQGLYDRAQLKAGEQVLIHGGGGAVGIFAVQLARRQSAHVLTTVSAADIDFVTQLGAHETIDYRGTPFEQPARDMDVVFDTVGGETLQRSFDILKPGGRLVTIASDSEGRNDERSKAAFFIVEPNREQLRTIAKLFDEDALNTFVDRILPISRAVDAYSGKTGKSRRHGKVVIDLSPQTT